jgi:hypothetical protein
MRLNSSSSLVKKIILDENLPVPLRLLIAEFDVFITGDKNLRYQQNIAERRISIVGLPYTRLARIEPLLELIRSAIHSAGPGDYVQIAG